MASFADVAMEPEVLEEEWDYDDAEDDWDYNAAEEDEAADDEEWGAMDWEEPEDTCHYCGRPAWFAQYPFCEECDHARIRGLLREEQYIDDDATTAAGDPPEELSDSDDWESEYELD
jgi:hypothetical protein